VDNVRPLPGKQAHRDLQAEPARVGRARRFVGDILALWDCKDPDNLAVMLTNEIVSNAVRYTHRDIRVDVAVDGVVVRFATTDDDPALPQEMTVASEATSGRGLCLVDALAARWDVEPDPTGKTVWFEVVLGASGQRERGRNWRSQAIIASSPSSESMS
jgi:anti-sigma regulatory factor (Ser/Thr protein kinase)